MSNPIVSENAAPGTTSWAVTRAASTQIQTYCDQTSYNPGDTVTFYTSTQVGGTTYTFSVYRMGWYSGMGGCLKYSSGTLTGVAQGYWDGAVLQNCPTALIDATTHRVEAGWAATATWVIPANAPTGIYLAQFTDANGYQTYTLFVVKGNPTAEYVYSFAFTTNAAYNVWGGYSLYSSPTTATKVSFNRPVENDRGAGTGNLFTYDLGAIKWLERQGYNLAYVSDIDLHVQGAALYASSAVAIIGCHDEYWTYEMRGAVETALAQGVNLCLLGANACYWQIRLESDQAGHANRTVVCYKVLTSASDLANDPEYGVNNTRVTTEWRDPLLNRPENTLWGVMYSEIIYNRVNVGWTVDAGAGSLSYLHATGLVPGSTYGVDVVGVEYDKIQAGGPSNLQVLGTTSCLNISGVADTSNTTIYQATSGAYVFASGSIGWTAALDTYRSTYAGVPSVGPVLVTPMQKLLAGVLALMLKSKRGDGQATGLRGLAF